jgi:N-acetyl-anhydromuramyl-L-alanine amidase AmpD
MQFIAARYQAARPKDAPIDLIVVHSTAGRRGGDIPTLAGKTGRVVSAHYYIQKDGLEIQFVEDHREAWHAGQSSWAGFPSRWGSLNWRSIGIELENLNTGKDPYPEYQIETCAARIRQLCQKWDIPMNRKHIVGHYEVSPGRKTDPRGLDLDDLVRRVNRWQPPEVVRWVVETTAVVNIREGRSTKFPIHSQLMFGERVVVDDDTDGWLHLADGRGFISKAYTKRS